MDNHYFVGHEQFIQDIIDGLSRQCLIRGLPGAGKSALLHELEYKCRSNTNIAVIYLDCARFAQGISWQDFLIKLASSISDDFEDKDKARQLAVARVSFGGGTENAPCTQTLDDNACFLRQEFIELFRKLHDEAGHLIIVLLLDNVEEWFVEPHHFEGWLSPKVFHELFAGTSVQGNDQTDVEVNQLNNAGLVATTSSPKRIPGFDVVRYLVPLKLNDIRSLLIAMKRKALPEPDKVSSLAQQVSHYTGGYPQLVVTLLSRLDIGTGRLEERVLFDWKQTEYKQWKECLVARSYGVPTTVEYIEEVLTCVAKGEGVSDDQQRVLKVLLNFGLLNRRGPDSYQIVVRALREDLLKVRESDWRIFFARWFPYSGERLLRLTVAVMLFATFLMITLAWIGTDPYWGLLLFIPLFLYALLMFLGIRV